MPLVRRKFLIAFLLILILLVPLWPEFDEPGLFMEEGSLLVYPELTLKGHLPYRDFETFYGPANIAVLSAVYAVTGSNIFAERAVGLLYRVLILGALFVLLQRWGTSLALASLVIAGFLFIPFGIPAFAWVGAVACALWSVWLISRVESARSCFFGGLLGAGALLFRPDLAPAMVASSLPLFFLMPGTQRRRFIEGVALGLLPFGLLAAVAGPRELLNNLLILPVFFSTPARRLPISLSENYLIYLFCIDVLAVVCNITAGFVAVRHFRKDVSPRLLLSLALLGLGLIHQATLRFDSGHLLPSALLSIGILPVSICVLRAAMSASSIEENDGLLAAALVLLLVFMGAPEVMVTVKNRTIGSIDGKAQSAIFLEYRGRSFPFSSARAALELKQILQTVEGQATNGDRLFVGPADLRRTNYNETIIYHFLPQLQPATYFLEMNPLSANRPNSRLASDVATADWLILSHHWDNWTEPNESMRFGSDAPMEVVRNNFQLFGRSDNYELYRRRSPIALRN